MLVLHRLWLLLSLTLAFTIGLSWWTVNVARISTSRSAAEWLTKEQCDMRPTMSQLLRVGVDRDTLARSVSFSGSGRRLKRVLKQILTGKPTKISILGGSISAEDKQVFNYAQVFMSWLDQVTPGHKTTLVNGAVPATGTSFYRYCAAQIVGNDTDLVLMEFAANDLGGDANAPGGIFTNDDLQTVQSNEEALLRQLLNWSHQPAVIMLHFGWLKEYLNAQEPLNTLAAFYDVPALSYKNMLFSWLLSNEQNSGDPKDRVVSMAGDVLSDRLHPTSRGHSQIGWALVHFFQSHVLGCDRFTSDGEQLLLPDGKDILVTDRKVVSSVMELSSGCFTVQGRNPNLQPIQIDDGWNLFTWTGEKQFKKYWQGTRPNAVIVFPLSFFHQQHRRVYVYSLVAPYLHSTAACWLDNDSEHAITIKSFNQGPWSVAVGVKFYIGTIAAAGDHTVSCQVLTNQDFRIIAILHD